jgi:hypothetical protein
MAVSDAVIGAGSALAGVLVTAVASAWNDGRRRRWEDERRWADRKRERYLDLLGVSRAVILGIRQSGRIQVGNLEQHVSGQLRLRGTLSLDQEFEVGQVALVEQAVRVAYGGWDELQIVAPVAIYRCADEHFRQLAAWRETLVEFGDRIEEVDPAAYEAAFERGLDDATKGREQLVRLLRKDLQPQRSPRWSKATRVPRVDGGQMIR